MPEADNSVQIALIKKDIENIFEEIRELRPALENYRLLEYRLVQIEGKVGTIGSVLDKYGDKLNLTSSDITEIRTTIGQLSKLMNDIRSSPLVGSPEQTNEEESEPNPTDWINTSAVKNFTYFLLVLALIAASFLGVKVTGFGS